MHLGSVGRSIQPNGGIGQFLGMLLLFFAIISRGVGKKDVGVIGVLARQRRTHDSPTIRPRLPGLHNCPTMKWFAACASDMFGDRNRLMWRRNVDAVDREFHLRWALKKHVQRNPSWSTTRDSIGKHATTEPLLRSYLPWDFHWCGGELGDQFGQGFTDESVRQPRRR